MKAISLQSVTAGYGKKVILQDVNLEIEAGFHILLGKNGAGKTTLFRTIAGILPVKTGNVRLYGQNPFQQPEIKRKVSYLSHRPALYAELTARDNLKFWMNVCQLSPIEQKVQLEKVVSDLELEELLPKRAKELSRGQAQKVSIARVLLNNPEILLLDEPTTGLDPLIAQNLRSLFKNLARAEHTLIYSTHNLYEASELAEEVIVLADGAIRQRGTIAELTQQLAGKHCVRLKVEGDPQTILQTNGLTAKPEKDYWIVELDHEEDIGKIISLLVKAGITVQEAREAGNPLEAIYSSLEKVS